MHDLFHRFHHDDGVVHHDADGQHHGKQGEHVDGEPHQQHAGQRAHQRHGDRQHGNDGGAHAAEEEIHHHQHQHEGFDEGVHHQFDGGVDEHRGVVGNLPLEALGETGGNLAHLGAHRRRHVQGVGARAQVDPHAGGGLAVEAQADLVVLGAEFDAGDVAHPHHRAVGRGAHDDAGELLRRAQAAAGLHRESQHLAAGAGRGADLADRVVLVLLLDGGGDLAHGELEFGELVRIDPDAHRIGIAEQADVAHAAEALQLRHHGGIGKIAEILAVEAGILRLHGDDEQHRGIGLIHLHAVLQHRLGQQRLDALDAVVHLDGGQIQVGARLEHHRQFHQAAGGTGGLHVEQPCHAVHLPFQGRGHGVFQDLGAGAGIDRGHLDLGRCHVGILLDRELPGGQRPQQRDDDRDDCCEDRPVDEESPCGLPIWRPGQAHRRRPPPVRRPAREPPR